MATNAVQEGKIIDHTAAAALTSGDVVVIGNIIGVAVADIAISTVGPVAIEGVFTVAKVSAAVIAAGEEVIWDSSEAEFDDNALSPGAGDISGCCVAMEAAGNAVTEIDIKLNVGIGTVGT